MSKTIQLSLSTESIEKAIKEIREYRETLRFKNNIFVQRLAELGLKIVEANKYTEGDSDSDGLVSERVVVEESENRVKATLILHGKDVAFIEFGAGVHYNGAVGSSPNPFGTKLGMTIGSYGKGLGKNDKWVYMDEESGLYIVTHGTKAAQPMAKADEKIRNDFINIAREVFK